jgi:hypothetical protein
MLVAFRVRNFRSIQEEQELLLWRNRRLARTSTPPTEGGSVPEISTLAGIYGANASGKSNILAALNFVERAVVESHAGWKPDDEIPGLSPFLLAETHNDVSWFEIEVLLEDVRFQYGFECDKRSFRREWLYAYPQGRRQIWFERNHAEDEPWYFGRSLVGANRAAARTTRPNALFLSVAAGSNHEMLTPLYHWFRSHLFVIPTGQRQMRLNYSLKRLEGGQESDERRRAVLQLLQASDLGIQDLVVRTREVRDADRVRLSRVMRALTDGVDGAPSMDDGEIAQAVREASRYVELLHSGGPETPVGLPFDAESEGTKILLSLSGPVLDALEDGDTLLIDEIDASLHPRLVARILRLFSSPTTNPKHAQLIFATHDTTLLGDQEEGEPLLERDQVWLVEKNAAGATVLYPLTDFSPRKGESIVRGYLQGRYGAVPVLADLVRPSPRASEHGHRV